MTWDAARKVVLLFGGVASDPAAQYPSSLWAWDGAEWRCLASEGPPGREDAELAFDPDREVAVLYGGRHRTPSGMRVLTDTWEWNGKTWTARPDGTPGAQVHFVLAPGIGAGVTLLGGAEDDNPAGWRWTGDRWRPADLSLPAGRIPDAMFLGSHGRTILLAARPPQTGNAFTAELWQWGRAGGWAAIDTLGPGFSPRAPAAATAAGLVIYLGWEPEAAPAATWSWTVGDGWRLAPVAADPGRRKGTAMAYDVRRGRTVLYGGDDDHAIRGDLWEWDGSAWRRPP